MEVVADASALLAVVLNEPERDSIIDATEGVTLISPFVLPYEIGNALIAMRKRRRIEEEVIVPAWRATQRIPVQLVPVEVEAALVLALDHGIYAYDAYYLQCSLAHRLPLIALDRTMRGIAKKLGIRLVI
ncbi:MAG TPA: type II toxin-antitoxin system VapC family toxin [Thermoanaerobaculia bacterium]|nr:type II toxin-antitoxin system VapC family toxin [Thermoanaerobaculia bacterium]